MSKSSVELNEENERTKGKEKDNKSKKTMIIQRNIQRVEAQGKRGKFKNVTTQLTIELLEYIKNNFDGYSLLVLSYIILGALISIRRLFLHAFSDTDEFLNEKIGLGKTKISNNQSKKKVKEINSIESTKELNAETLRTLFNKSLMSEFEKFKSSKIHLSKDLFEKIQNTLYKMKIPTMTGVTEQDFIKYEEEKIINPLLKKIFTQPLPSKAILHLIKDSQADTQNFANLVGINIDSMINKEGVLGNGQFFPDNQENNDYLDINNDQDLDFNSSEKKADNIRLELIKKNDSIENLVDKNHIISKKDKEFFEFDIPTYLEMTKEENEDMTIDDIKNAFHKNLGKINNDSAFILFQQDLKNNKYHLTEEEFYHCESIQKNFRSMDLFGYYFYGNGKDYYNFIKNELMSSGKSSDSLRYNIGDIIKSEKIELNNESDSPWTDIKGKTFNPVCNYEFNMDDTSIIELNSQIKIGDSQMLDNYEKNEKEKSIGKEVINELKNVISKTKFYQNTNVDSLVDKINENTSLLKDNNDKEKKSLIFYNLMICCQINGFNLQQNNLFSEFFFAKSN